MKTIVTKDGLAELERELEQCKTVEREKIADEIERAREQGDLSENASYKAAMEKKEFNEVRISDLEVLISEAVVTEETSSKTKVGLGTKVKVINETINQEFTFELVGQTEADPSVGKVSVEALLGKAMNGSKVGGTFKVLTPGGEHLYKVLEII